MNERKLRVLFVGAFPPAHKNIFGGFVTDCRALLSSTLPQTLEIIPFDSTQASNPPPSFGRRLCSALVRMTVFAYVIAKYRPNAALIFTSSGASLLEKGTMAWIARACSTPVLLFPRGSLYIEHWERSFLDRIAIRYSFSGASKLLCQAPDRQRFAVDQVGLDPRDTEVVLNWTASSELLCAGGQRTWECSQSRPVSLLFVGWVEEEKGVFDLIEACRKIRGRANFHLNIVGDGAARGRCEQQVRQFGLDHVVSFSGWLAGQELLAAYRAADIFVLPSWREGFPNAIVEAMACALCVVTTQVGSIPYVLEDGVNVALIQPREVDPLANLLIKLIFDRNARNEIARNGHKFARANFTAEAGANAIVRAVRTASRKDAIAQTDSPSRR